MQAEPVDRANSGSHGVNYRAHLDAEIERLMALKALNPALRGEEITRLETRLERGVDALAQARATLQEVRLALTR